MPLNLAPDAHWPPAENQPMLAKMAEWAAWYSGEPERIIDVYAASGSNSVAPVPWWRFWSRARAAMDGAQRAQLHVPVASDLAAVSGSLLFGEPPKIRIRPAREQDPEPEDPTADPAAKPKAKRATPEEKAEGRLLEVAERSDLYARLVEAAESAAAIGGVYIYPAWDKDVLDTPFMAYAQADMAAPEFRHGFLVAVTFYRIAATQGTEVIRHLERHEVEGTGESRKAVVLHALFKGTATALGSQIALDPSLVGNVAPRIELPLDHLDVRYVPNIRPNRLFRASGLGVADIQGSESLLDALDETYASWMRDVRLAKARILVPREYLRRDPDTGKPAFDVDQEIYVPMDMEPGIGQDARAMLAHQFMIRHLEHSATAENLIHRIVSNAGYEPATIGGAQGSGNSGAALRISEHKTLLTLRRKSGWWRSALAGVLEDMQAIDREVFGSTAPAIRPAIITADSIIDSPLELAQTALAMKTAESASIETRVRLLHPDWSNAEVDAEVLRIKDDVKAAEPPAAVSQGAFGKPTEDPAATDNKPVTAPGEARNPTPPTPEPQAKQAN